MRQGPFPRAAVARFGQAYWFFGNLYEAVVDVPQLLADAHGQRSPWLLGPGSPVRYYAPIAPLTLAATAATLIDRWRGGGSKAMINDRPDCLTSRANGPGPGLWLRPGTETDSTRGRGTRS
jgi:hypothetical protein